MTSPFIRNTNSEYFGHEKTRTEILSSYLQSLWVIFVLFCFVDCASRYIRVKKNQLDAQLILRIFRQPLHVSHVSRPIIRIYNRTYTTIGTFLFFLDNCMLFWLDWSTRTTDSHINRIISTNCCIHKVVYPDDGPRYARNM